MSVTVPSRRDDNESCSIDKEVSMTYNHCLHVAARTCQPIAVTVTVAAVSQQPFYAKKQTQLLRLQLLLAVVLIVLLIESASATSTNTKSCCAVVVSPSVFLSLSFSV